MERLTFDGNFCDIPLCRELAMSADIIVRCAAAALGVSAKQLCEVVALGKAGRLMVLPDGEAMPSE